MKIQTLLLLTLITLAFASASASAIIIVDDDWAGADHSRIQDALDEATEGETVRVNAGSYEEDLVANISVRLLGNGTSSRIVATDTALVGGDNITIEGFYIQGTDGIQLWSDAILADLTISVGSSGTGISVGNGSTLDNVTQSGGKVMLDGSDISVAGGSLEDVALNLTGNATINGTALRYCAITLYGSGSTITRCDIRDSSISIENDGNLIYDNVMRANDVSDSGDNAWNVTLMAGTNIVGGVTLGGNFWYEYDGLDNDDDGIGEEPFAVDEDSYDMAPLIHPEVAPTMSAINVTPMNASYRVERTFSLVYTDMNNEDPEYVRSVFDGFVVNLTRADADEPINGTLYNMTCQLPVGNHTFHFETSDGTNHVTSEDFVVIAWNSAPTLDLQVDPKDGYRTTNITILVTYTDADDDEPEWIMAYITVDNGTDPVPLNEVDPDDTVMTDGKEYSIVTTFVPGDYGVVIRASDGNVNRSSDSVEFRIANAPPELRGSLDPDSGTVETHFNFTVVYRDIDGDPPQNVSIEVGGATYPLYPAGSGTYEEGIPYTTHLRLDKGYYEYRFVAVDSQGNVNSTRNHTLVVQNTPPDIVDIEVEIDDGFHRFNVTVEDKDGEEPKYSRLHIDEDSYGMKLVQWSNTTFKYHKRVFVPEGVHQYYVQVSDDTAFDVSEPEYLNATGYPDLLDPSFSPAEPCSANTINFTVIYRQDEGIAPEYVHLLIDGSVHQMNLTEGDYMTGATYALSLRLSRGIHVYSINASDGRYLNVTDEMMIDVRNTPPDVALSVIPAMPMPGDPMSLTISYEDHDGDAPTDVRLYLDDTGIPLTVRDLGDGIWSLTGEANATHGDHVITVRYGDGFDNDTLIMSLPVDRAPAFNASYFQWPNDHNVTINVTVFDGDDDPVDVWLDLNGTRYPLMPVNLNDTSTVDGMNFTITAPFPEGHTMFEILVNDTILEVYQEFGVDVTIVINTPPELHNPGNYPIEPVAGGEVLFQVHYIDRDGDEPERVLLVLEDERYPMRTGATNLADALYSVRITMTRSGNLTYHIEASDGQALCETGDLTLHVVEPEPVETDTGGGETGPLDAILGLLREPLYLMALVLIILALGAAMGVASRGRSVPPAQAGGPTAPPYPGYGPGERPPGPPPVDREPSGIARDGPEHYPPSAPPEEVEFMPATVEFSPGAPPPEVAEEEEETLEWYPRPRHTGGPFIPARGSQEPEEMFQPVAERDEWDEMLDSLSFDKRPRRPPEHGMDDTGFGDFEDDPFADEGGAAATVDDDDGWADDGWGDDAGFGEREAEMTGTDVQGWGEDEDLGDAEVRELKPRRRTGMFDDIEEVDLSDMGW